MAVFQVPEGFPTIQAAVNAARPGDTVKVASGFFSEDVIVPAEKARLRIEGGGSLETILLGPGSTGIGFTLNGTTDVEIIGFGIQGFSSIGILVNGGTNTVIKDVAIENSPIGIWLTNTAFTCVVEKSQISHTSYALPVGPGTEHALITHNWIHDNTHGVTTFINSHRVQVVNNRFSKNILGVESVLSRQTLILNNDFDGDLVAVCLRTAADFNRCVENHLTGDDYDVAVISSSFAQIMGNVMAAGFGGGVTLIGSNSNQVLQNRIEGKGGSGVRIEGSNNNEIEDNQVLSNSANGIRLLGTSTGNVVRENFLWSNAPFDINDHSTGANTFDRNDCQTSRPPEICRHSGIWQLEVDP